MEKKYSVLIFQMFPEDKARLVDLAKRRNRTMSELLRMQVLKILESEQK